MDWLLPAVSAVSAANRFDLTSSTGLGPVSIGTVDAEASTSSRAAHRTRIFYIRLSA